MEWVVLDPCDQALNPEEVEQELYINHCLWWAWAAIMWMGCEVAPKVRQKDVQYTTNLISPKMFNFFRKNSGKRFYLKMRPIFEFWTVNFSLLRTFLLQLISCWFKNVFPLSILKKALKLCLVLFCKCPHFAYREEVCSQWSIRIVLMFKISSVQKCVSILLFSRFLCICRLFAVPLGTRTIWGNTKKLRALSLWP